MKKILFALLLYTSYLIPGTVLAQSKTYFHDRVDTTIYATTTGTNTYTGTNTDPNFNVAAYMRGLMVSTFIVNGNTGAATYRLVTRTGTLSSVAIKKANGAALVSGDIPDSTAILLMYYGSFWRLVGIHASAAMSITVGTTPVLSGTSGAIPFNNAGIYGEDATVLFWDNADNEVGFGTNAPTARTHIKASGTTFASGYGLKVDKSDNSPALLISNSGNSAFNTTAYTNVGIMVSAAGVTNTGTGQYAFYIDNDGTFTNPGLFNVKTLAEGGNVGIAVNNPQYLLHIKNSTTHILTVDGNGAGGGGGLIGMGNIPEADTRLTIYGENNLTTKSGLGIVTQDGSYVFLTDNARNVGFNKVTNWDAASRGIIGIGNDIVRNTTLFANQADVWCEDISAGNAALYTRAEGGEIFSFGTEFGTQSNNDLNLATNATTKLVLTTDGRLYGTALHNNAGAVTGTTNQYVASGTYTPTITDSSNTGGRTAYQCQWKRVGNVVTVSGVVDVDPTLAATSTIIKITLPIASNFTNTGNLGGTAFASGIAGQGAAMLPTTAYAVSDFALMQWISGDVTNQPMRFSFTYVVL